MESLDITCLSCHKLLSKHEAQSDEHTPCAEVLLASGAVPVPNCGWFCSQACAILFEQQNGVRFDRNAKGQVQYYP